MGDGGRPDLGCYVGVSPCGCRLAAIVIGAPPRMDATKHRREVAKTTAKWMRDGMEIERLASCDDFRNGPLGCKCPGKHCQKRGPLVRGDCPGAKAETADEVTP